ncbi:MAG: DUF1178 family protein [Pseudomonadota bacterium]
MISLTLVCVNGHSFDGWFRGNADFDSQCEAGLVVCPTCGETNVRRGLMAPNVSTARRRERAAQQIEQAFQSAVASAQSAGAKPGPAVPASGQKAAGPVDGEVLPSPGTPARFAAGLQDAPEPVKAYVEAVRKLRTHIEQTSDDVGDRFAEEARKMHHGETDERPIRGRASIEEAASLDEEGIEVFALPTLPEDGH